jgi:hypothetical protein
MSGSNKTETPAPPKGGLWILPWRVPSWLAKVPARSFEIVVALLVLSLAGLVLLIATRPTPPPADQCAVPTRAQDGAAAPEAAEPAAPAEVPPAAATGAPAAAAPEASIEAASEAPAGAAPEPGTASELQPEAAVEAALAAEAIPDPAAEAAPAPEAVPDPAAEAAPAAEAVPAPEAAQDTAAEAAPAPEAAQDTAAEAAPAPEAVPDQAAEAAPEAAPAPEVAPAPEAAPDQAAEAPPEATPSVPEAAAGPPVPAWGAFEISGPLELKAGESFEVQVKGAPPAMIGEGAQVGLYRAGAEGGDFIILIAVDHPEEVLRLEAPASEGAYEVRAYSTGKIRTPATLVAVMPLFVR